MLCPVPIIPYEETYRDIWSNPSNVGAPVSDTRIDVTVGFSLDGVPDFALGFAPLTVYYDPKIDTWLPDRVRLFRTYPPHNQRQLEITVSLEHYNDVIMSAMASQITGVAIVCSTVSSGADQRQHQSSTSLASVCGEFTGDRWIPCTKVSNVENISIWWRHHGREIH